MRPGRLPIEGDRLEDFGIGDALGLGLTQAVGDPRVAAQRRAAGFGGSLPTDRLQHPVDRQHPPEGFADVGGHDGAQRLEAALGQGGLHRIAASGAYPEQPEPVLGDERQGRQVVDGAVNVLDPSGRVLQVARRSSAFPLVRRVKGQGDEAATGQSLGVDAADLLLHAAARRGQDQGGVASVFPEVVRQMQIPDDLDVPVSEGHASHGGVSLLADARLGTDDAPAARTAAGAIDSRRVLREVFT